jgi:D-alanine-D-alanine ligase
MYQNIILLFGGDSDERLVSVASAQSMALAIKPLKIWFWHPLGQVYEISYEALLSHKDPFIKDFQPKNRSTFNDIVEAISSPKCEGHIFLLALHGGSQENGDLQEKLEKYQRHYTGSSAKASRIAFNKINTKNHLAIHPIKMSPHKLIEPQHNKNLINYLKDFFDNHGACVVKPVCSGSSLACFFIKTKEQLEQAAEQIEKKISHQSFFIEKLISGREITVGVIEDDNGLFALPCTEIIVDRDREFDYQGKYLGLGTKEITPANLPENLARKAQRIAKAAHAALALDGYSRTDMILSGDGFYFLETNTLPGLTKQSLMTQQLAAAGITMREFINTQIKLTTAKRFF